MNDSYYEQRNKENILKLRQNIKTLPPFVSSFLLGINDTTSILTRIGYSLDLRIFFNYLINEEPAFYKKNIRDFTIEDLKKITVTHIKEYMEYLSFYIVNDYENNTSTEITNGLTGKSRKISAIRSMYNYFLKAEMITYNPSDLIETPKIKEKNIISLEVDEIANLIDEVESGSNLTAKQKTYHDLTKKRDLAIIMVILGTGMRISECVGINLNDIDFRISGVKITRKGGNESIVYFSAEVEEVLQDYIALRKSNVNIDEKENALFLSLQNKRISQRAVQNLVKKYAKIVTPLKNISPHKLRSTYATNLYRESGDIYLVADALGHSDVNTTKKHYAKMDDSKRREASRHINLR